MDSQQFWLQIVPPVLGAAVAVLVPLIMFKFSKRLKEMEARDRERDREFEVSKVVTTKAVEVLAESYHITHRINYALNVYHSAHEEAKKSIESDLTDARKYWEKNMFYLPETIRNRIIRFTNYSFASLTEGEIGARASLEAFDEVSDMFKTIEGAFRPFMKKYNLLDSADTEGK